MPATRAPLRRRRRAVRATWPRQHIEDTVYRSVFDYSEHNQLRMSRLLDQSRNIVRARLAQLGILMPRDAGDADARLRRQA